MRARAHPAYDRENGQSATSGASAITVGAAALLLQMNPALKAKRTGGQIRTILHNTAVSDVFTGHAPNSTWGLGKAQHVGGSGHSRGDDQGKPGAIEDQYHVSGSESRYPQRTGVRDTNDIRSIVLRFISHFDSGSRGQCVLFV